ncbi:conserved hypothetical protein [Xanthomonas citri pv. citri]|uniref:Lipoprotein n=1 Tax=Xanthomonas citri pv. citri TaxID=611301 RepID=A0A0U5FBP8_XANCI|nr:hypothetical protein BHE84_23540 [Xanthomonas citri pv. glycines str. 8ra]QDR44660.1 hypothetical protein FPK90_08040 [Xanthomonas citri pv. glycines]QYF44254.1 hypothetical protein HZS93_01542 [Xanthomonas citri]CEE30874.1 conserved hypothetical protein [Xanthomonas citri pv. citri]QDS06845.1 hypothetical protein FPL00_08060 [Xanthomonas citri pv. glycines]
MFTHAARGGAAGIAVVSGCWGAAKGGRLGGAANGNSLVRRAAARLALRSPQAAGARQKVDGLEVQ